MKEFLTYKSGKFYFSDQFDLDKVQPLLIRAEVLHETIADLPILPELASRLKPETLYGSIAGTAGIEGNPITGEDVRKIAEGQDIEKYAQKHKTEIINLIKAYDLLSDIQTSDQPFYLTEELIQQLHQMITVDVPHEKNIPGNYRNGKVCVGDAAHGGIYTPPKILEDISNLMKEYIEWINSDEIVRLNPFVRASLAHYHFSLIHPFWDGNGRTARLIEAMALQSKGIAHVPRALSNYYYRNVDDYYIAFSKSIGLKTNVTPFVEFAAKAAVSSLSAIKQTIVGFIRKFSLRDFIACEKKAGSLTQRQHDLLCLLLDNPAPFTLKDLWNTPPFSLLYGSVSTQTARRDLKKLSEMNLILQDPDGRNYLNLRVLG